MCASIVWRLALAATVVALLSGCGAFRREQPTRTPVPTFTPTPLTAANAQAGNPAQAAQEPAQVVATQVVATQVVAAPATVPPTPVSPTNTPLSTSTPSPTSPPTNTPLPTATATVTPTPSPSPTPDYTFELESAEKFPTDSLAPNVVRVYLYVYSTQEFGLEGYSLQVTHNGAELPVDQISTGGLPEQTRTEPSPYTRFTNMNVLFVEAQAGDWRIQLVNSTGQPVGPPAEFQLTGDEITRELYVRYKRE